MLNIALIVFSFWSLGGEACRQAELAKQGKFVAHEWGTFTSFANSQGTLLDFRTESLKDLPNYVYDRSRQAGESQIIDNGKELVMSRQRMETPVIYFYSDREREVDVSVYFKDGLLTEFFPPVQRMTPVFDASKKEGPVAWSSLQWGKIKIFPICFSESFSSRLPRANGFNHYEIARGAESSMVRFCDKTHGDFYEKFLFYRGVANFSLPEKLQALFLIEVNGDKLQWKAVSKDFDALKASETTLAQAESNEGDLHEAMKKALVEQGLYEKEAQAMVKTWQDSWFREPGRRLFYILPRDFVDSVLPLNIQPAPQEITRVFVGRLEVLTSAKEKEIRQMVEKSAARGGFLQDEAIVQNLRSEYGRFAESALQQALAKVEEGAIKEKGKELLRKL